MGKIIAYNFTSLDGYYKAPDEDISWHRHGKEEEKYSEEMLANNNILLFGRKTYEHMAAFWPTPDAKEMFPKVASGMNIAEKVVFSNSLNETYWTNSRIQNGDIVEKMIELKQSETRNFAILGSGSIINLFTDHDLIDEYQFMIDPVAIGNGVSIFSGIGKILNLKLAGVRTFKSGVVLLTYDRQ